MFYFLYKILFPLGKEIEFFKIFNLFQYVTFRSIMAVITTFIISLIIGPKIIAYLREKNVGQYIRELGPKTHYSKSGTPTMGGIIIIISVFISTLLWSRLDNFFTWYCLFALIGFGFIGFIDDYLKLIKKNTKGLPGRIKIVGQVFISLLLSILLYSNINTNFYFPFFVEPLFNLGIFFIVFSMIVMISSSNAVNLTDGLDGLAIGLSLLVIATFAVFSYLAGHKLIADYLKIPFVNGSSEITVFLSSMGGAGLGFLWFNSHPAEVFMGDTGSLGIGGLIGSVAVAIKQEVLLVVVGGIFVMEAISVILQVFSYKTRGKKIFRMAPLHHHFEVGGIPESKVIIRFWIIGILLSMIGFITLKIR